MYRPRTDYLKFWELTSFYDTSPLRETLSKYVAWDKLTFDELKPVDPSQPRLILAATNIETGKIDAFDSRRMTIEPDHVLASGALPPGFPAAAARDVHGHTYTYWDGGLYNNTPLAQVIHALENENRQGQTKKVDMMIVVNLFPKKSRLPVNLFEVTDRSCEIIFATKTSSDSRRASETRKVIGLKDELEGLIKNLPDDTKTKFAALMKHPGYDVLEKWKPVFDDLIEIAYTEPEPMDAAINFAKETIERRRRAGYRDAMARYEEYWKHPKTPELQRRSHSFNAGRRRRGNTWPAGKKEGANMELRFEQKSFFSLSVRSALQNAGMFGPARSSGPESGQETDRPGGSEATAPAQPSPPPIGAAPPDFHRIAYTQWGDPHSEHIVCVHGFARNGRDFDFLAERLSTRTCVVCPDIVGRGRSDWLRDPTTNFGYSYAQYMLDITGLIGCLSVHEVDWIGTSLGGLLGMMMAAAPRSPVRRLVMNDVGPQLPASLTPSLLDYLADEHIFSSPEELRECLREHYCGATKFGNLTEVQLRHVAKYSERRLPDGRIGLAFDHENMSYSKWMRDNNTPFEDVKLWDVWTSVRYSFCTAPILPFFWRKRYCGCTEKGRERTSLPFRTAATPPH